MNNSDTIMITYSGNYYCNFVLQSLRINVNSWPQNLQRSTLLTDYGPNKFKVLTEGNFFSIFPESYNLKPIITIHSTKTFHKPKL